MKKGILFALAALCVSAVQAVTINWTAESVQMGSDNIVAFLYNGDAAAAKAFVSGYRPDLDQDRTNVGDFKNRETGNSFDQYEPYKIGSVDHRREYIAGNDGAEWADNFESGTTSGSIDVFANGYNDNILATWDGVGTIVFIDYEYRNDPNAAYYYEISAEDVATLKAGSNLDVNVGKVNVVPEPTALALLALGVAGLALRRKA